MPPLCSCGLNWMIMRAARFTDLVRHAGEQATCSTGRNSSEGAEETAGKRPGVSVGGALRWRYGHSVDAAKPSP